MYFIIKEKKLKAISLEYIDFFIIIIMFGIMNKLI